MRNSFSLRYVEMKAAEGRIGSSAEIFLISLFFLIFSRYLQNVRIDVDPGRPPLEFDADGTRSSVELTIVNLQPSNSGGSGRELLWRQVKGL